MLLHTVLFFFSILASLSANTIHQYLLCNKEFTAFLLLQKQQEEMEKKAFLLLKHPTLTPGFFQEKNIKVHFKDLGNFPCLQIQGVSSRHWLLTLQKKEQTLQLRFAQKGTKNLCRTTPRSIPLGVQSITHSSHHQ